MRAARLAMIVVMGILVAAPAWGQFVLPSFVGQWKPAVGGGALYLVEGPGRDPQMLEASIVGEESHAYWLEMTSEVKKAQTIMKILITGDKLSRVILKITGKPAVEVPPDAVVGGGLPLDVKRSG